MPHDASCEGDRYDEHFRPKLDLFFPGWEILPLPLFFLIDGSFMCKIWGLLNGWSMGGVYDGRMAFVILHQRAGWVHDWMGMGGWMV
jgi:hypothetical protein